MVYKIPLSATPINTEGLTSILQSYEGQPLVKIIDDFEDALRKFTGSKYVLALNSGTAAIHLALKALGVRSGDTVIAPTFTYVASVSPILYLDGTPFFVDSDPITWNICPELLESVLKARIRKNEKPRCVIVVQNFGMTAQMSEIQSICSNYEIPILEDAAEAIGSRYKGSMAGTFGQTGIFSFNNNKLVTAFGGGALLTENEEIYQKALFWATQSREDKPYYEHRDIGFNYRMSPLNAAAGLFELSSIDLRVKKRRQLFEAYKKSLVDKGITWLDEPEGHFSNRWLSTFLFNPLKVNEIMNATRRKGIECRRFWNPMHMQPYYQKYPKLINGFAEKLFRHGLCLPSSNFEVISEVSKVIYEAA